MKIRGYNCPVKQLTVAKMDELKDAGFNALRIVEPYGFVSESHLQEILEHSVEINKETILTLYNSNVKAWEVASKETKAAFLTQEKQDEGRATRCLLGLGIRGKHKDLLNWMMDEAMRLKKLTPGRVKIELWNPDVQYWGTDWKNWLTLKPEFLPLYRLLNPGSTPTFTGFSYLNAKLNAIWPELLFRTIRGGFMYGESWGTDTVGLQSSLMEFGANVHDCPQKFYELLPSIRTKYRVYCQWLVDPAFDGYSDVTSEALFDAQKTKELYAEKNYGGDSYCLLPTLGWEAARAFAAS